MKNIKIYFACTIIAIPLLTGCSNKIKKIGDNAYSVSYKSYKSEEDARRQALHEATLECTGIGKIVNILNENKVAKRGFLHVLEFECID